MSFNTFRKRAFPLAVASAFLLTASFNTLAANDGSPGADSEGDLEITVNIPKRIRITGMEDVSIQDSATVDAITDEVDIERFVNACVGGNGAFTYGIVASSTTGFNLVRGDNIDEAAELESEIPYTLSWKGVSLDPQLNNQTLDRANLGAGACNNADNLAITIAHTDLAATNWGVYSDTLTLTVTPE